MVASYKWCFLMKVPGRVAARGRRRADPALGRSPLSSTSSPRLKLSAWRTSGLLACVLLVQRFQSVLLPWLPRPSFYRPRRRPRATRKGSRGVFGGKKPLSLRKEATWLILLQARPCAVAIILWGKGGGSALTPPPTKTEARPSSWSPSLLAPSAHVVDLILLRVE